MDILTILFAITGCVGILIAIPLIMRWIGPNYVYGVRTRKTLSNPALWYDSNEYFGRLFFISGIVITVGAVTLRKLPGLSPDGYTFAMLIVTMACLMPTMLLTFRYIRTWQG